MKVIYLLSFFVSLSASCQNTKAITTSLTCIEKHIDSNKNNIDWMVGSVEEYEFQGKLVYAFRPPKNIADAATFIKTSDCKDLCTIGGFRRISNGLCNGANFSEKAIFKRMIWSETPANK